MPHTYRTTSSVILAIAAAVLAGILLVGAAIISVSTLPRAACMGAAVLALAYLLFWNPRVQVSDGGINLVNVMRTTRVPWPRYRSVSTRWTLEVSDDAGRSYASYALPRSKRPGAAQEAQEDIESRYQRLHEAASAPTLGDVGVERAWQWPAVAALVVAVSTAVAASVMP